MDCIYMCVSVNSIVAASSLTVVRTTLFDEIYGQIVRSKNTDISHHVIEIP